MWVDYWGAKGYVGPPPLKLWGGLAPPGPPLPTPMIWERSTESNNASWLMTYILQNSRRQKYPRHLEYHRAQFFLLYINDLPENIQSRVRLFVDDVAVYPTVAHPNDNSTLQNDLDTLQQRERTWDMEFNPSKCRVLHISKSRQPIISQYTLHGEILEAVQNTLG